MAKQGHLNLKNAQYSMPADAAAYQSPPFYYRNTRSISVAFETDTEAAEALRFLQSRRSTGKLLLIP